MNIDDVSISNVQTNTPGKVLNLRIKRGIFYSPKFRFIRSKFERYDGKEVIEIYVLFDKPLPVRASPPTIYIGENRVTEGEYTSDSELKFIVFEPDRLKTGLPISIGGIDDVDKMINTGYRYTFKY